MSIKFNLIKDRAALIHLGVLILIGLFIFALASNLISLSNNVYGDGLVVLFIGIVFFPFLNYKKYKYIPLIFSLFTIIVGILMLLGFLSPNFEGLLLPLQIIFVLGLIPYSIKRFSDAFLNEKYTKIF